MYKSSNILVTGGLGFIGGNLVHRLAALGAKVTVVDSLVRGCGGNRYNAAGLEGSVRVVVSDVGNAQVVAPEIRHADVIFNLAGEISHIHSMRFPDRDAHLNAVSQLRFLQECVRERPGIRVVYASTRQIYGTPQYLPVDERHPVQPVDFNGIHKYAATAYHRLFTNAGQLDAIVFCLTNVYGPRMGLDNPCQGFLSNFIRRGLMGQTIEIFGDGRQVRDPVYVDDVVDLFLAAGNASKLPARLYNVGGPEVLSVASIAAMISGVSATQPPVFRPFPEEHKAIDIGSYSTDWSAVRNDLGWSPRVGFAEGLERTMVFFRREFGHYLDRSVPNPGCKLAGTAAARPVPAS